jgi:hypothetical protein
METNALLLANVEPGIVATLSESRLDLEAEFKDCVDSFLRTADKLEEAIASADHAAYRRIREQLEECLTRCGIARCSLERFDQRGY